MNEQQSTLNLPPPGKPESVGSTNPTPQPDLKMGRSLGQMVIILIVVLVLVNIPINYYGFGLAHLAPESPSTAISEGTLLKGSGPEIYVLQDHELRWISSPELLARYFGRQDVKLVDDSLLEHFGRGQPVRQLLKCQGSPNTYVKENGLKRWIQDPPSAARTRPWDRVRWVSCGYLRGLPDGLPIESLPAS